MVRVEASIVGLSLRELDFSVILSVKVSHVIAAPQDDQPSTRTIALHPSCSAVTAASLIKDAVEWWLIAGGVVAALFLTIGVDRIDEDSRGAYAFRPLLIPGILLIWPLVLWRWVRLELGERRFMARYQPPRSIHLPVAILLAMAVAFSVVAGLAIRQTWPAEAEPILLEAPGS